MVGVVTGKIEQQWLAEDPAKNQQRLDEVTLGKEPAIQGEEIYRARPLNGI